MKLSKDPSRVVGLQVGEVSLTIVPDTKAGLVAHIALVLDDGTFGGKYTSYGPWGDKIQEAVQALVAAIEEETIPTFFQTLPASEDSTSPQNSAEPPQI